MVFAPAVHSDIATIQAMDPATFAAVVQPTALTITSIIICNGDAMQIGTFTNYNVFPIQRKRMMRTAPSTSA